MAEPAHAIRRQRLWLEFTALFIGVPLAIALFLPPQWMFRALGAMTLVGLALLWRTGGFDWRSLRVGWSRVGWLSVIMFGAGVAMIGWLIMNMNPAYQLNLSPARLRFLTVIWALYPILSALPQELIFRVLFFHRYGTLFADPRIAVIANAAIFSFAHLMYWSSVVTVLTFAGGLIFAHYYLRRGFPTAWLLHGVAGNALFTVGMGAFFYSGNVVRPF